MADTLWSAAGEWTRSTRGFLTRLRHPAEPATPPRSDRFLREGFFFRSRSVFPILRFSISHFLQRVFATDLHFSSDFFVLILHFLKIFFSETFPLQIIKNASFPETEYQMGRLEDTAAGPRKAGEVEDLQASVHPPERPARK